MFDHVSIGVRDLAPPRKRILRTRRLANRSAPFVLRPDPASETRPLQIRATRIGGGSWRCGIGVGRRPHPGPAKLTSPICILLRNGGARAPRKTMTPAITPRFRAPPPRSEGFYRLEAYHGGSATFA